MNRFPLLATALDGSIAQLGDLFDLFGVTDGGRLVTDRTAPYEAWLSYSVLDALIHENGRWFVGKLATTGRVDEDGIESRDLCPIGNLAEVSPAAALEWLTSLQHFGHVPPKALEAFAKPPAVAAPTPEPKPIEPPAEPTEPPAERLPDYVTIDQAAAAVHRSKRTFERYKTEGSLPSPDVEGGGGKPDLWDWSTLRPWLVKKFGVRLPERFFDDRR